MVKILRLFGDMSFTEKNVRVDGDKVLIDKDYRPSFELGVSTYKEKPKPFLQRLIFFWKRPRNLMLLVDGSPKVVSVYKVLEGNEGVKAALHFNFGTMKDTKDFIYKLAVKAKVEQKTMNNMQFFALAGLLVVVIIFQFLLMKGYSI